MSEELRAVQQIADEMDRHLWYASVERKHLETAIRRAHAAGASLRAIGEAAGLSAATILRILRRDP